MTNNPANRTLITIGDLAKRYGISVRTLRLYQEMGLLMPEHTDDFTGYRYYSPAQFPRLEMILQMKTFGIPLKNIRRILDSRNLTLYEALISRRVDELDREIAERRAARSSLLKQLSSLRYVHRMPELETCFIEFLPRRRAYFFDIPPYDFRDPVESEYRWKSALELIRNRLEQGDIPQSYLSQVGCCIRQEDLMANHLLCSRAFLLAQDEEPSSLSSENLPSSIYACMFTRYTAMNAAAEARALTALLSYIRGASCRITGPYYGEVVAETSFFDYTSSDVLVKMQVPIAVDSGN